MAVLAKVPVTWSSPGAIGSGVSIFYTDNIVPGAFITALRVFYDGLKAIFPEEVTFGFPTSGDTISDTNGQINGAWSSASVATVTGTMTGAFALGVGARVRWNTAGITRGRRVKGTTFLVPIGANQFSTSGYLAAGNVTAWESIANTLRQADGGSMRIFSRPTSVAAADGASHAITSVTVPDMVSWLRSRRT